MLLEDVEIPAGTRNKGKKVLQPDALLKLFQVDTTTYYRKRIQDPYIYAYRFQVLTGLRPGELMGLRWADVHGNTLQISRSINIEGTQTRGKNDNSVRAFVMSELARAVLEQQRQQGEQSALRAVAQCAGDPHALQAMLAGFLLAAGCRTGRRRLSIYILTKNRHHFLAQKSMALACRSW